MLEIKDLTAGYGDAQVLFGTTLDVRRGEVVAIIGSNGVGKTTLMRTVSGLLKPTGGSILLNGEDITGRQCHDIVERGIAMVPEGRRLFPRMSVRRNLELGAYSARARNSLAERLEYVFTLFPILKERQQQLGGTLSGGEQQMCAIGRGLIAVPDILMLDELSLGLAPIAITRVYEAIKRIRDSGVTLVIVEQNVGQALAIADRAYVLSHGRVVLSGTGQELSKNADVRRVYLGLASHMEETK